MRILIVRIRQMGDTILSTPLFNTLRKSFPDAVIDLVVNERIAKLMEGHPALNHVFPLTAEDHRNALAYLRRAWTIASKGHYDVVMDMRSTMNTLPFSIFAHAKLRIGLRKPYTKWVFNRFVPNCGSGDMVAHNLLYAEALKQYGTIIPDHRVTLHISEEEQQSFDSYLKKEGVKSDRPLVVVGVTAKLDFKRWDETAMTHLVNRFSNRYPEAQLVFNYAPGEEEAHARKICSQLEHPERVLIDIQARSPRELYALACRSTFFFGNEGGARHIFHAAGVPSFVICAPGSHKSTWLPKDEVPTEGIEPSDLADAQTLAQMDDASQYALLTEDIVWQRLSSFLDRYPINSTKE